MTKTNPSVPALSFHDQKFTVTKRHGQPWLRGVQITTALGYRNPAEAAKEIYKKHAAEFTDSMTAVVKLKTTGGMQDVRIFSLRGAHLLGMFARTERAAEFRRWVLDILDHEVQPVALPPPAIPALPAPDKVSRALRQAINRKAHEVSVKQYDNIHAILTEWIEDNMACGATEAACFGYVETAGSIANGTAFVNVRDLHELVHVCADVIDRAGAAIANIKRIEDRSGLKLYNRIGRSKFSDPDFHKHDRLIEEVIDRIKGGAKQ